MSEQAAAQGEVNKGDTVLPTGETEAEKREREKGIMIPKYRFDAVRAREKQLISQMEELQSQLQQQGMTQQQAETVTSEVASQASNNDASAAEIKALSTQHAEAVFQGDTEKAAEIQAVLMQKVVAAGQSNQAPQQDFDKDAVINEAVARFEVARIADELEATYSVLDRNSKDYSEEINTEIIELYEGLTMRGEAPASALSRAADLVLASKGLGGGGVAADAVSNRGISDKVAAASAPGVMSKDIGVSSNADDGPNIENMSADEWAALPDSARNKLLGI